MLFDPLFDPALRELAPRALWIDVGKRGYRCAAGQATIDAMLITQPRQRGVIVRLKGGDTSIFGRLEE